MNFKIGLVDAKPPTLTDRTAKQISNISVLESCGVDG